MATQKPSTRTVEFQKFLDRIAELEKLYNRARSRNATDDDLLRFELAHLKAEKHLKRMRLPIHDKTMRRAVPGYDGPALRRSMREETGEEALSFSGEVG